MKTRSLVIHMPLSLMTIAMKKNLLQCLWTKYSVPLSKGRILMLKKFTFSQMDQVLNLRTNIWSSSFPLFRRIWEQESCGITLQPHMGKVQLMGWEALSKGQSGMRSLQEKCKA